MTVPIIILLFASTGRFRATVIERMFVFEARVHQWLPVQSRCRRAGLHTSRNSSITISV